MLNLTFFLSLLIYINFFLFNHYSIVLLYCFLKIILITFKISKFNNLDKKIHMTFEILLWVEYKNRIEYKIYYFHTF